MEEVETEAGRSGVLGLRSPIGWPIGPMAALKQRSVPQGHMALGTLMTLQLVAPTIFVPDRVACRPKGEDIQLVPTVVFACCFGPHCCSHPHMHMLMRTAANRRHLDCVCYWPCLILLVPMNTALATDLFHRCQRCTPLAQACVALRVDWPLEC